MSFFDQIIGKIFPRQENPSPTSIKEILKRTDKEQKKYLDWLSERHHEPLVKAISQAYFYKKTQISSSIKIHLFNSQGAEGFAIDYMPDIGQENFQHLFDYLKNRILEINYFLQASERRILDKGSYVETTQKYYLKPKWKHALKDQNILNQLYGNILIELIHIDRQPGYIKFLVTHYQDRLFTPALDYDELINCLFIT